MGCDEEMPSRPSECPGELWPREERSRGIPAMAKVAPRVRAWPPLEGRCMKPGERFAAICRASVG